MTYFQDFLHSGRIHTTEPANFPESYFHTGYLEFTNPTTTLTVPFIVVVPRWLAIIENPQGQPFEGRIQRLLDLGLTRITELHEIARPATKPWTALLTNGLARIVSRSGEVLADAAPFHEDWAQVVRAYGDRVSVLYAPGADPARLQPSCQDSVELLALIQESIDKGLMIGGLVPAQWQFTVG